MEPSRYTTSASFDQTTWLQDQLQRQVNFLHQDPSAFQLSRKSIGHYHPAQAVLLIKQNGKILA